MEEYFTAEFASFLVESAVKIVGVFLLLFIALRIAAWLKKRVYSGLQKTELDDTLAKFVANLTRYLVIIGAILGCFGYFGIPTTSFAAVIGAAGLAIGLAFQGTLGNFAAGAMLLTFRPFKVGDVIAVAGVVGEVNELELFTTKLDTPDNRRIILPNSAVFGSTIENITFHDKRRVEVNVGTDYSADLDEVRAVLAAAAETVPGRLVEEGVDVALLELGGSSIDWQVRVWSKSAMPDYLAAKDALTRAVKIALDAKDIGIPFPQMDVHIDGTLAKGEA